jgi:PAS domain S-box-containing protein
MGVRPKREAGAREELRVAEGELREQNEELAATRASLEAERQRYVDLFEFAPVAYLVTDLNGAIREANRPAAALLDMPQSLLVGKPLVLFVASKERRDFRRRMLAVARGGGEPQAWDLCLLPRNRPSLLVEAVVRRSAEAGPRELRWSLRDVEERRRIEEEVRRLNVELEERVDERSGELASERARLEAIVQQLPGGVVIVEAPSGRILVANEAAAQLLPDAVVPGTRLYSYPLLEPLSRSLESGESVVGEFIDLARPDGSHVVLEASSSPIRNERGEIGAAVLLFFDVSERERRERAEREFVTNAAHQLQTPLAGIMSAVDVLQAGAKDDPESRERFLAHVERECARLDRLARALLLLARVQMGVEPPRRELVELLPLLEETAAALTPAPGVTVEVDCPPDLALVTNRHLAAEMLTNLGSNAAKYTAAGGIVLRARRENDTAVTVEVADTGPGVPAAERGRVFERFFRGDGSESRRDGAGLGLAIVRAAADALGGDVELRSTPGGGTTVAITLPGARLLGR